MTSFGPESLAPNSTVILVPGKVVCTVVQSIRKIFDGVWEDDSTGNHGGQQVADVVAVSETGAIGFVRDEIQSKIEDEISNRAVVVVKGWLRVRII